MNVLYSFESFVPGIFLAGPTPRSEDVGSWRPEALEILKGLGYSGDVYVPEARDWKPHSAYEDQISWEWAALDRATVIVFWIPRDLDRLPGFTTNIEFGMFCRSGKVLLGRPDGAKKMKYIDRLASQIGVEIYSDLRSLLLAAKTVADSRSGFC